MMFPPHSTSAIFVPIFWLWGTNSPAMGPAIGGALSMNSRVPQWLSAAFFLPSPGFSYAMAFDRPFTVKPGLFVLSMVVIHLLAWGFLALASLVRSANAVRAVSFVVFYPMMFFSGGTIPGQFLPPAVQTIAKVMPMTYTVNLVRDLWFGKGWDLTTVAVLVGFTIAGILISVRFFRWE